jgi:predicted 3-demethylubiquinone-9 3-methyltransferase (glyoxalase superfamily)
VLHSDFHLDHQKVLYLDFQLDRQKVTNSETKTVTNSGYSKAIHLVIHSEKMTDLQKAMNLDQNSGFQKENLKVHLRDLQMVH